MNTPDVETKTDTATEAPPDQWPPLAHIFAGPWPVKPGDLALCGAKLMGIDLRDADGDVCEKCLAEARRRLGI